MNAADRKFVEIIRGYKLDPKFDDLAIAIEIIDRQEDVIGKFKKALEWYADKSHISQDFSIEEINGGSIERGIIENGAKARQVLEETKDL